jgi:hypothetical protein
MFSIFFFPVARNPRVMTAKGVGFAAPGRTLVLVVVVVLSGFSPVPAQQETAAPQGRTPKDATATLIPWMLREKADLIGIPFAEVIFDTTGNECWRLIQPTKMIDEWRLS